MKTLARIVLTLIALGGAFSVYAWQMRPLLVVQHSAPSAVPAQASGVEQPQIEQLRVAKDWLSEQAWASQSRYKLRTGSTFIYTNEWQPQGDQGLIRFRPFAMVSVRPGSNGTEEAITIVSESALIKFAGTFDTTHPKPGRVVLAALEGEVQVKGPQGLLVAGRNLFFDEAASRAWSAHPVQFAFGQNRGSARRLELELIPASGPPTDDRPHVAGVRSIRLIRDVKMDVYLKQQGAQVPVRILCNGTFEYLFEEGMAVYEDDVRAFQQTQAGQFDGLQCNRLTLLLEPKQASDPDRPLPAPAPNPVSNSTSGGFQEIETDLQFAGLVAEGSPVRIRSDAQQLRGEVERLTYSAEERRIILSSSKQVLIRQQHSELRCPEIELLLGPNDELTSAVCSGPGDLEAREVAGGEVLFAVDWQQNLRKLTDPTNGLDVIEVTDNASFRQRGSAGLSADLIRVWLPPVALTPRTTTTSTVDVPIPPEEPGQNSQQSPQPTAAGWIGNSSKVRPKRLVAEKNVALVVPGLVAEVESLEVAFLDADPAAPSLLADQLGGSGASQGIQPASGTQTPPRRPSGLFGTGEQSDEPPAQARARSIRVDLRMTADGQPEVQQLWANGAVEISQQRAGEPEPMVLTGEEVQLNGSGGQPDVMEVTGSPAHVRHRGLHIEGATIRLDQTQNLAEVRGKGLLQFPVPKSFRGEVLQQPTTMDVWWTDRMTFEGQLATFHGNVQAVLEDSRMSCRLMEVTLNRRIRFDSANADLEGTGEKLDVETIVCRDGVDFENHQRTGSKLTQVQRAKVFEFTLDQKNGHTTAQGPGWMQMWWRGEGRRPGLNEVTALKSNRPASVDAAEWEYLRVDFAGNMVGNLHEQATSFRERVKIVYGPVDRPTDVISPDALPKQGGWMTCNELQLAQERLPATGRDHVQLVGSGNASLEGGGFSAQADQISYDESKGLFVIRSFGKRQAEIWYQAKEGGQRSHTAAQRMEYIPSLRMLNTDRSFGGEGSP